MSELQLPEAPVTHVFHRVLRAPMEGYLAEVDEPLRLLVAAYLLTSASRLKPLHLSDAPAGFHTNEGARLLTSSFLEFTGE